MLFPTKQSMSYGNSRGYWAPPNQQNLLQRHCWMIWCLWMPVSCPSLLNAGCETSKGSATVAVCHFFFFTDSVLKRKYAEGHPSQTDQIQGKTYLHLRGLSSWNCKNVSGKLWSEARAEVPVWYEIWVKRGLTSFRITHSDVEQKLRPIHTALRDAN